MKRTAATILSTILLAMLAPAPSTWAAESKQKPPRCLRHCPVVVTPSPGPFGLGTPGRKAIPRPPAPR